MHKYSTPYRAIKESLLLPLALLLALLFPFEALQASVTDQQDQLLQFTANGHALRFESDGLYIASGDHMLHVGFVGADGTMPEAAGVKSKEGKTAPLIQVNYANLWPGINLRYEAADGSIARSTWEVSPGADTNQILLRYNAPLEIAADGSLKIQYETGWMRESAPIAWQEIEGHRHPVAVAFRLLKSAEGEPVIGFEVGQYSSAHSLLIDPTLEWNTFMSTTGRAIAVDGSGNVYVVGESGDTWGTPVDPHMGSIDGGSDVFVAKLDSNGERLWHTFMGGTLPYDYGNGIAVDDNGNVYVAGSSRGTWGTPVNAHADGYSDDAFAAKLDTNGTRLWNTFMGSSDFDIGRAIALDGGGNVYVAGDSNITWGTPVNAHTGGYSDAFVAKLNSNGTCVWNTFMGSTDYDFGSAIAVSGSGNVYVAGYNGTYVPRYGIWADDAFVTKLSSNGTRVRNTIMGSSDYDIGNGIAVDDSGNVFVAGESRATWGTPVDAHTGGSDAFVAKLRDAGCEFFIIQTGEGKSFAVCL